MTVHVNVEGAQVFVDEGAVGRAPLEDDVYVEPGSRVITARLSGYAPASKIVEAAKGSAQTLELTLSKLSNEPVAPPASASATATRSGSLIPATCPIST